MTRSLAVLLVGLLLPGLVVRADDGPPVGDVGPEEVIREAIEVPLRSIRVVVTDGSGDPVPGLEVGDFRLLHDAEPLAVEAVEPLRSGDGPAGDPGGPPAVAESEPPRSRADGLPAEAAERRDLVLFVEPAFLAPGDLSDLGPLLEQLAAGEWAAGDVRLTLLVAARGIERLAGPTGEPRELVEAWSDRSLPPGDGVSLRSEYRSLLGRIESVAVSGPDVQARTRELLPVTLRGRIESYAAAAEAATRRAVRRLEAALGSASGLGGRVEIVYLGGRLPGSTALGLRQAWVSAFGPSSSWWLERGVGGVGGGFGAADEDVPREIDPPTVSTEIETVRLLEPVVRRAGALGIVVHVLDAGGLRDDAFLERDSGIATRSRGGGPALSPSAVSSFGDAEALRLLADGTGGTARIGTRTFRAVLGERHPPGSYRLFFRPPVLDGEVHDLEVEVEGPRRWNVSHPSAYRFESRDDALARQTVTALLLELGDDDPLGFEIGVRPAEERVGPGDAGAAGREILLRVALPLERVALVPEGAAHVGSLSVYYAWGGLESGVSGVRKARIPVRIPNPELFTALGQDAEAVLPLEVPTDAPALAVTMIDELRSLSGTRILSLDRAEAKPADDG